MIVVQALCFISSYAEPFVVFEKDSLKVKELKLVGDEAGLYIDAL